MHKMEIKTEGLQFPVIFISKNNSSLSCQNLVSLEFS